jgi:hypothetical protein
LFALPLARAGHTVTAVEENRQAVNDGIANAQLNRIPQTRVNFVTARTEDYLRRLRATPDFVVLDPPRQGCAPSVIQCVFVELRPPRVIYVSCNPEAFARELPAMLDAGYHVDRVLPVDMFPHTNHVELVATLSTAQRVIASSEYVREQRQPNQQKSKHGFRDHAKHEPEEAAGAGAQRLLRVGVAQILKDERAHGWP